MPLSSEGAWRSRAASVPFRDAVTSFKDGLVRGTGTVLLRLDINAGCLAESALDAGLSPNDLLAELGYAACTPLLKFDPNQPRVPAWSGAQSGQWTSGRTSGAASATRPTLFDKAPRSSYKSKPVMRPCWMIHLSPPLAQRVTPPSDLVSERFADGSLFLSATNETFDVGNSAHVEAAHRLFIVLDALQEKVPREQWRRCVRFRPFRRVPRVHPPRYLRSGCRSGKSMPSRS